MLMTSAKVIDLSTELMDELTGIQSYAVFSNKISVMRLRSVYYVMHAVPADCYHSSRHPYVCIKTLLNLMHYILMSLFSSSQSY